MNEVPVLVAGGRTLIRAGLCALLEKVPGLKVVAEASDGSEAFRLIGEHQPAAAVINSTNFKLNAFDLTARITNECPNVHVVIISSRTDEDGLKRSLSCGALGYLPMTASVVELELAIKRVASGEMHVSPSAATALMDPGRHRAVDDSFKPLTPRQRDVLRLIAEGYSTKQIALALNISVKTVQTHRMLLTDRLDIHSTAGLIRYAIRNGLASVEDSLKPRLS
jgi:DNA-binding NarL/FixJ family response regulator